MSKKSILILIFLAISILLIISLLKGPDKISYSKSVKPENKKRHKQSKVFSSSVKKKKNLSKVKTNKLDQKNRETSNIDSLISQVKSDLESCKNKMNELFGAEDVEINFKLYTDFEMLDSFKKFNKISFNSEKTHTLLSYIANEENVISKKEMDQLGVITPCRVFQKINFLDEVKRRLTQSQNALLLQDLKSELNGFFRKEVSTSSSVASLTMALNMIESFSDSSGLNFSKREQEKIDQIIDDMEVDYEKMLVSVEEDLSSDGGSENQELSKTLIRSEIELNKKYKSRILDLLGAPIHKE